MCFPLDTIKTLIILAILIFATFAILGLLIPFIAKKMGIALGEGWALVLQILRIAMWALFAIFLVLLAFEVIFCLWSFAGGGLRLK